MRTPTQASVYDRIRDHLDAADLLRRLGLNVVRSHGSEAHCTPLCHESTSGESLHVNLHTGRWICRACSSSGVFGDLIQLVEYVQTGGRAPSHGAAQKDSPTHAEAVRWLCGQFAIPYDVGTRFADPALDALHVFAMMAHEYLLTQQHVLDWIAARWGFDLGTVQGYGIGFMPDPLLPALLKEAERAESRNAFRASGLGWYDVNGRWQTRFAGRVTFPYLEHGRAVYLIGRATPWTPAIRVDETGATAKPPKYHKLSVYSERRPYVSPRITNDHLYNEPAMQNAERVVVAEGVADAVALSALGVPVISPVTISFNATDLDRFATKCHAQSIARVEILFDNELSGSGEHGARRVAEKLVERGLSVSILELPLGEAQRAAREEVMRALGEDVFAELQRAEPHKRKQLIRDAIQDDARCAWIMEQVEVAKIDAAEWCALRGSSAASEFVEIRRAGVDVIDLAIADAAAKGAPEAEVVERMEAFADAIAMAAHVDERLIRDAYAAKIAKAAGRGISKAAVAQRIAEARRAVVKPKRKEGEEKRAAIEAKGGAPGMPGNPWNLVLQPPDERFVQPDAPSAPQPPRQLPPGAPKPDPNAPPAPAAPALPVRAQADEHELYAPTRQAVALAVERKAPEEDIGKHVAQTIMRSMGFTPFRTPEDLHLVRGAERVDVGVGRPTAEFDALIYTASGLTRQKASHRAYIAAAVYFLTRGSHRVRDVSWSHVDASGAVYFPTADRAGTILKIEPGKITRTRMAETPVPAVAGPDFRAFRYVPEEEDGWNGNVRRDGVSAALNVFRWTSLSETDRLVLIYWIVVLPVLRRIGSIPITRIEGGASSGKTRAVDAASYLVNGGPSSCVPTAAALVSRLSKEMLTIDDNRETKDVTPAFLGTLLQATNLGAREKRKGNSDTGTVVERICGSLLMNGIEPIHDGRSELTSRMLVLRSEKANRSADSPRADETLLTTIGEVRDRFWSESVRRCAAALELDKVYGEDLGAQIEVVFGSTRIGRLSAYLRMMYLAWVAGISDQEERAAALHVVAPLWVTAFQSIGSYALSSLVKEEMSVAGVRYAFAWGDATREPIHQGADEFHAFGGIYRHYEARKETILGPVSAPQLARMIRAAGKELNAPRGVAVDLRAGQLEARLLDGVEFLEAAGFFVEARATAAGKWVFTFGRVGGSVDELPPSMPGPGDPVDAMGSSAFWDRVAP